MQYFIIDMCTISEAAIDILNATFTLWKKEYQLELTSRGQHLCEEDFWNCRFLGVLKGETEIIAAVMFNSFDLRTNVQQNHKYFKDFPNERIENLKSAKLEKLLSMEYLLVNPLFRKSRSKVNWAEVIVGLGFVTLIHTHWDAAVGIGREDKKISKIFPKMGGIETDFVLKYGTPCRIVIMESMKYHPHVDVEIRLLIESLWNSRLNFAQNLVEEASNSKITAA